MKYSIFVSLVVCFILYTDDVKANFTKEACMECCKGLSSDQYDCRFACLVKFTRSQNYNSRKECNRSCTVKLYGCKQTCLDDCVARYEFIEPGTKPLSRQDKARLQKRKASEFLGLNVRKTTTPEPGKPKRYRGPNKSYGGIPFE